MRMAACVGLLCLLLSPVQAHGEEIETLVSPAGHQFFFFHMPEAENVALEFAWPSTWAYEASRNPAVPHLGTGLMVSSGAGGMDAATFGETFDDLVAQGGIYATVDTVQGDLFVQPKDVTAAVELANLVLVDPALDERWLTRSKDELKARVEERRTQSADQSWNAVRQAVLGDEPPSAFLSLTDTAVIDAVTREDVLAWWRDTFVLEGSLIAVAGPISADEAATAVDMLLAGMPRGEERTAIKAVPDFTPRTIVLNRPEAEKSTLGYLARLPAVPQGGAPEDFIIEQILGGGDQSRLFDAIRTTMRASYGFGADMDDYTRDIQFLVMTGEVETERLAKTRDVVRQIYETLRTDGPTEAEVDGLKSVLSADIRKRLNSPQFLAMGMIEYALDGFPPERVLAALDEVAAITVQTVRERLDAYPPGDSLIEIIVTPSADVIDGACVISTPREAADCP